MTVINLLSPQKKKKLKDFRLFYIFKSLAFIITLFIIIIVATQFATQYILETRMKSIDDEVDKIILALPTGKEVSLDKIVTDINKKIDQLKNVQKDYIKWSSYLADFSELIPKDISLINLSFNSQSKEIQINGRAILRDNFINFRENLENSEIITNIESPISNLIKKEDVDFNLKAKMVLDQYKL